MYNSFFDKYKLWIIGLTVILILILFFIYLLSRSPDSSYSTDPNEVAINTEPIEYDVPTVAPSTTPDDSAVGFTGYQEEEEFTPQELSEIDQKNQLREQSPYDGIYFTIDYNYETFEFDVILYVPYDASRQAFDEWIENNYPAIPEDQFNFIEQ